MGIIRLAGERHLCRGIALAILPLLAVSCASMPWNKRSSSPLQEAWNESAPQTGGDHEGRLRDVLRSQMTPGTSADPDPNAAELVYSKPYYYKAYDRYPGGVDSAEITVESRDSRIRPYAAEVTAPKIRYTTRLHRERSDAQADTRFFREQGTETISYELRNGRWMKTGALFVVGQKDEYINGEWVPVVEEVRRSLQVDEEEGSWFNRFWRNLTGR